MALKKNDAKAMAALEAKLDEELEATEVEATEATEEVEVTEAAEEVEVTEAAEEVEVTEATEAEATEVTEEAGTNPKPEAEETLVKVENLSHSTLYQHSTGLTIAGKSTKSLRNDGWLKNQIAAKLLKRV